MTFYNIIFGILFLESCRQLLNLSGSASGWTAATIAVIVFNDTVHSSQLLEGSAGRAYKLSMKYLDLAAFLLLSLALIALNPDGKPFSVELKPALAGWHSHSWIVWALLAGYWAIAWTWNWASGLTSPMKWKNAGHSGPIVFAVAFALMSFLVGNTWPSEAIPMWLQIVAFGGTAAYLVIVKLVLKPGLI